MTHTPQTTICPIRIGISSCLLGENVRFDGGHKRDTFIVNTLGQFFQWIPVCPEFEMGLGVPRETLRLVGTPEKPRLLASRSQRDHTVAMQRYAAEHLETLATLNLHGYILKKNSPSCGMERVRVYGQDQTVQRSGHGLFARALMQRFPLLPVEEEGRLQNLQLRENFIERVCAYSRWQHLLSKGVLPHDLVRFHTQHKLTVLAHSRSHYQLLGQLVAQAGNVSMAALLPEYGTTFMTALKVKATPKKHANVLYHLLGYLKEHLDTHDKVELVATLEDYRKGLVPLVVPMTLLLHHFRRHPVPWISEQTYLQPYPAELMLRNHV